MQFFPLDFSLFLFHVTLFMLECVRIQFVLTGGSGGGNATSPTLRIHFHVSHPPFHLIVILPASAFKPSYANVVFWVSGCLFLNHFIIALLIITSLQIIVQITVSYWWEMQDIQMGRKKSRVCRMWKGNLKKLNQ